MTLATIQSYIYKRTKTNSTSFPNADMVLELNTANERCLSLIRGFKDTFHPTAWTTSDLATGTATPVFDSLFHELIPLWVVHQYTSDSKLRSQVADEIKIKEQQLRMFYGTRHLLPVTVTIASPAVFTLPNHGFLYGQELVLSTTGALPTGLSADTVYFCAPVTADTFQVYASITSTSSINTTGSQNGTHYVSGLKPPRMTMMAINYI